NGIPLFQPPSPLTPNATPEPTPTLQGNPSGGLSDWIIYRRECCIGQPEKHCPLYTEGYLQAGPTIPFATTVSRQLAAGWSISGGLRAVFFDESMRSAWVIDGHIINTYESGGGENKPFPLTFFSNGVRSDLVNFLGKTGRKEFTIQNFNRTSV